MPDNIMLKEFGGNLKPVFQRGKGNDADKEVVTRVEYDLIPIQNILRNAEQPRKNFPEDELKKLAESIKKQGIIQPIVVRPKGNNEYELIAGERRLRASEVAELIEIPALVKEYNDKEAFFIALIENLQREDLNPIEEALAYQKLMNNYSLSHEQIGIEMGRSRVAVTNMLRLLSLEPEIKDMLERNLFGAGHARALISLAREEQLKLADRIIKQNLTARDVEKLVSTLNSSKSSKIEITDNVLSKAKPFSERLTNRLSTKVQIKLNNQWKGRVVIHFESEDELSWLVDKIDSEGGL